MENEIWKDIEGFEKYQISSYGRVRSYHNNTIIIRKTNIVSGYEHLMLNKNNKKYNFYIHRLVGTAFIPNPENKPEINHKNGLKTDNNVENLEWTTRIENAQHAWQTGLCEHNHMILKTRDYSKLRKFTKLWSKPIYSSKLNMQFESVRCASRYIQENYYSKVDVQSIKVSINDLIAGRKQTSMYDYGWSYINK